MPVKPCNIIFILQMEKLRHTDTFLSKTAQEICGKTSTDSWSLVSACGGVWRGPLSSLVLRTRGRAGAEEYINERSGCPFPQPQRSSWKGSIKTMRLLRFYFFFLIFDSSLLLPPQKSVFHQWCYTLLFPCIYTVSNLEGLIRRKAEEHWSLRLMLSP